MVEGESPYRGPMTLKSQIYEARRMLYSAEVLEKGDEALCSIYEASFGFLRQWIESVGNDKEKKEMAIIAEEYDRTEKKEVHEDVSTRYYNPLYYLTFNRDQSTRREVTDRTFDTVWEYMEKVAWADLKRERMRQYQKLWDIFNEMTDADEDVGNKNLTANKLRGNYDVNND